MRDAGNVPSGKRYISDARLPYTYTYIGSNGKSVSSVYVRANAVQRSRDSDIDNAHEIRRFIYKLRRGATHSKLDSSVDGQMMVKRVAAGLM